LACAISARQSERDLRSGLKERLVVSEFPSLEKAIAGHDSPGYQEALRARRQRRA
jgi:uncharacterized protein (DUF1330 family)